MRDLHNNIKVSNALNPQNAASNGTKAGNIIDTQGYESLEFALSSGVITDGTYTTTMTEGNQANLSDGTAVAAGDMLGSLPTFAASDDNVTKKVGYKGNKRYVRLDLVAASVTTGGLFGATAVQGNARNAPVA